MTEQLIDPSTLPHKEQHRLRASAIRQAERTMAFFKITDYKNATPTFPKPKRKRASRAKPKVLDVTTPEASLPASMSEVDRLLMDVRGGKMTDPVPYHPNSKSALITRLNANLRK